MQAEPLHQPTLPAEPLQSMAPLPLRARGVLDILDTTIKLYRQYFWILLGWASIGACLAMIPYVMVFAMPLIAGPVACCIAAAVRGQSVGFSQCWRFTTPRYWPMTGMYIVSGLICFVVMMIVGIATAVLFAVIGSGASAGNGTAGVVVMVVLVTIMVLGWSFLAAALLAWQTMVSVVVCLEDDKRNTNALTRAFQLLRGNWMRAVSLLTVLSLGVIALLAILCATAAFSAGLSQIKDVLNGTDSVTSVWIAFAAMGLAYLLLVILSSPAFYLMMTLLYLDARVRKEALDLEWTAHATAPEMGSASDAPASYFYPGSAAPVPLVPLESQPGQSYSNQAYPAQAYSAQAYSAQQPPPTAHPAPAPQWNAAQWNAAQWNPPPSPAVNPATPPPTSAMPAMVAESETTNAQAPQPTPHVVPAPFADATPFAQAVPFTPDAPPPEAPPVTSNDNAAASFGAAPAPVQAPEPASEPAPNAVATIKCPQCGTPALATQTFCNACGARIKAAW